MPDSSAIVPRIFECIQKCGKCYFPMSPCLLHLLKENKAGCFFFIVSQVPQVTFTCTRQEYGTCIPCVHFNVVFCLQGDFSVPGGGNRLRERLGPHKVRGVDTRGPRGQTAHRPGYVECPAA